MRSGSPPHRTRRIAGPWNLSASSGTGTTETFSATSGFVPGVNTVAIDLWNEPYEGANPAALDFCFIVSYSKHGADDPD